jgi:hypothetical protein
VVAKIRERLAVSKQTMRRVPRERFYLNKLYRIQKEQHFWNNNNE